MKVHKKKILQKNEGNFVENEIKYRKNPRKLSKKMCENIGYIVDSAISSFLVQPSSSLLSNQNYANNIFEVRNGHLEIALNKNYILKGKSKHSKTHFFAFWDSLFQNRKDLQKLSNIQTIALNRFYNHVAWTMFNKTPCIFLTFLIP